MKILRAEHLGMCFGVRDAITLAIEKSNQAPLTILGDLVHNERVLEDLRARGVQIAQAPALAVNKEVVITAHGASQKAIRSAQALGLNVTEATCPLVHLAHRAVAQLVRDGYHPVIIGKRDHVEVRGVIEDLEEYDVVLYERDVEGLVERPRFGVAAQTTQPIDRVRALVEAVRLRFPRSEVRFIDTVCQPTKLRQNAAVELAQQVDVVIVIGGRHSNNTHQLVQSCQRYCSRVHHVQTPDDLLPDWFGASDTVGITAGTSTPDLLIDAVEAWFQTLFPSIPEKGEERAGTPMPLSKMQAH